MSKSLIIFIDSEIVLIYQKKIFLHNIVFTLVSHTYITHYMFVVRNFYHLYKDLISFILYMAIHIFPNSEMSVLYKVTETFQTV